MMSELEQLKSDEGYRGAMYKCPADKWTIGYGFNLEAGMTRQEAEALLDIRLSAIGNDLRRHLPWVLAAPAEVANVLENMAYQMGVSGLLKFKNTLGYLERGEYTNASYEMLDSEWWRKDSPERAERLSARIVALSSL